MLSLNFSLCGSTKSATAFSSSAKLPNSRFSALFSFLPSSSYFAEIPTTAWTLSCSIFLAFAKISCGSSSSSSIKSILLTTAIGFRRGVSLSIAAISSRVPSCTVENIHNTVSALFTKRSVASECFSATSFRPGLSIMLICFNISIGIWRST